MEEQIMTLHPAPSHRLLAVKTSVAVLAFLIMLGSAFSQSKPTNEAACRIQGVDYKGWQAQQISNRWVELIVVPQNGGRLMQVTFAGHAYLFVNPKLAGKYFPPSSNQWFNYGGDKLWLLPEGNDDEKHWVGNSDILDDGPFTFRKISEGQSCEIELTSPGDPQTGIQFVRTIHLDADSPRIAFHWIMKNVTGHTLEWSMQSVSQYDTSVSAAQAAQNRNFWTFTPANKSSSYLNRYHVRFGPAENPAVRVRDDDLFTIHYAHMAAELWLDSTDGWLAVVDENSQYAMVERFQYDDRKPYPGKASVIFWTNGPEMHLNSEGNPQVSADADASPYYLEAEVNSPMCRLRPGESCTMDTEWFPTRSGGEFHGTTDAGILIHPLTATVTQTGTISLSGTFGVFYSGHLVARLYDEHGHVAAVTQVAEVSPDKQVPLDTTIPSAGKCSRVSLHLIDDDGVDRGALQEVQLISRDSH
ncbi:MAG TPA: hypothetical protein VHW45_10015 [Candidatus Sulfotelmatobacter sp.]|jgi:hypothetical protein|nr:hypothetical protein [Candidatus Sulfotelmatobacter sp.]